MRRRLAESLAILLSIASLGAGAASRPSSLEAAKVTQPPVIESEVGTELKMTAGGLNLRTIIGPKPKAYEVGTASWYGEQFQGKQTASGEPFDMRDFTAAHPTLPLGSFVKVTNLRNGRVVVVRVNDRGPVVEGRIIDLSYNAARALGFKERGVQRVRLDLYQPSFRSVYARPPASPQTTVALLQPVAKLN
jgi:rare lipoprotein A (peptidoglycan hydrolase)